MQKLAVLGILALAFAVGTGCAMKPRPVTITVHFDKEQAQRQMQPGKNSLQGNAFMRQAGGGVVTCAGNPVLLTPATEYAKARIMAIYGNDTSAMKPRGSQDVVFEPDNKEYRSYQKATQCDSQGNFSFENIADGDFYIVTGVFWSAGSYNPQGGYLMRKVHLANGQQEKIIMAP